MKEATSFRLSEEALALIRELAESLGVSQASVVEMAVRRLDREDVLTGGVGRPKKES